MFQKNISKVTVVLMSMIMLLSSSCKKSFLEKAPPTALPPDIALATESDVQVALRGAYAGLRVVDYFGRTVPLLGDLMADNAYISTVNTGRYTLFNTYTFNVTDANVIGFWRGAYTSILRANNIINSTLTGTANINQYKGEAYAIRALSYFYLVRYFARPYTDDPNALGVPLVTTYAPDFKPTRSKVSEVYALILSDLTQAYTLMTQFTNSSQFSKYAARALQAKVYLTMNDRPNAKTAALDVIANSGFTVVPASGYLAYWATLTPQTTKLETLFEVSSDANANSGFDGLANIYNQSGYGDALVADDLYASFAAGDIRKSLYTVGTHGGLPATNANLKYTGTFGSEISDTKIIRMSEVYLIAAEASLPGDEAGALTYLNYITSRRGAAAIASTGSQLFEDIITERRKELAFEGDRYLDLQRLKRDVVRNAANFPATALSIPYSNFRRVLPIPQAELDANPNIRTQQNSGY